MEKFENIESYFRVVNQAKKENKPTCTNCYLNQDKIAKLIEQRRLYYEKLNGGILIYVDEKRYYEVYYYLNVDAEWHITSKNKNIVVKNIYVEGKKNRMLEIVEEKLKASGFYLLDRLRQVQGDVESIQRKIEKQYEVAFRIMKENGFSLVPPDKDLLLQIRELEENIDKIPIYQIPYFEDEEIITIGREGRVQCIVNEKRELCAMNFFIEESSSHGYTVIKEEYQEKFGFVIVLTYSLLEYLKKRNIRLENWIEITNLKSIKYNLKIGYKWGNRYTDEWVLESKNKKESKNEKSGLSLPGGRNP